MPAANNNRHDYHSKSFAVPSKKRGKALVVDDDRASRFLFASMLESFGYQVIEACDGLEAIEVFEEESPDIVFLDILMPVMDGYQAATCIKSLCGHRFVPVVFLTASTDEHSLARCITSGGDDFLTKPVGEVILESKIQSLERIRALHSKVHKLYSQVQQEQKIAEEVFSNAVVADNVAIDQIGSLLKPAALFSGDVLLTAYTPSGDLNVMLGDFTGHGLAAALGALPASEAFRAMTAKGFSADQILRGINAKLNNLLPSSLFMAAQFVTISRNLKYATVCNCGMQDMLVLDKAGAIKRRIVSEGLPLGISAEADISSIVHHIDIQEGERILLVSDGVPEARNAKGDYFGEARLEEAIINASGQSRVLETVTDVLNVFTAGATQDDDISFIEIPCNPALLPVWQENLPASLPAPQPQLDGPDHDCSGCVEISMTLQGRRLRQADPVPLIINHLQELDGIQEQRRTLFTILTELYVNALDHGVLGLDSSLKNNEDGFVHYYAERERMLNELDKGMVKIQVCSSFQGTGGRIAITLEDSGSGFDHEAELEIKSVDSGFSGRGIRLVKELCESLHYKGAGSIVEAIYTWSN